MIMISPMLIASFMSVLCRLVTNIMGIMALQEVGS